MNGTFSNIFAFLHCDIFLHYAKHNVSKAQFISAILWWKSLVAADNLFRITNDLYFVLWLQNKKLVY